VTLSSLWSEVVGTVILALWIVPAVERFVTFLATSVTRTGEPDVDVGILVLVLHVLSVTKRDTLFRRVALHFMMNAVRIRALGIILTSSSVSVAVAVGIVGDGSSLCMRG